MSASSDIKHTGPGPIPEDIIAEKGLPQLPAVLANDDIMKSARMCLQQLFDRFNFIDQHEAQLAVMAGDDQYKLSKKTRNAWANRIRRQIGPAAVLVSTVLFERAFSMKTPEDKDILRFIVALQRVTKSIQANQAVKALIYPYTLKDADPEGYLIRARTRAPALPELRAALDTNVVNFRDSQEAGIRAKKDKKQHDTLNLGKLQWEAVRMFLVWKKENNLPHFALVEVERVVKHLHDICAALKTIRE